MIRKIRSWVKAKTAMIRRKYVLICGCGEVLNDDSQDSIHVINAIYQHTCPQCGTTRTFDFSYPVNRSVMFVSSDNTVTLGSGYPH